MPLWKLYYHLVWSTHDRQGFITLDKEGQLYGYIVSKSDALGCIVHAIGGMDDHLHLVVSIPPKISISDFVKQIKGSSSHYFNHNQVSLNGAKFNWQNEYGVFSLGSKQLEQAIAYVKNQKQHHAEQTTIPALEQTS
jgi:putative transposase